MNVDTKAGHPDMDYPQAVRTYNGFIRFVQISVVSLVVLLAGMAYFLV
jgi:Bacterial aa3 type cytochrome c oxidase subunit IV